VALSSGWFFIWCRSGVGVLGPWWPSIMLLAVLAMRGDTTLWNRTSRSKRSERHELGRLGTTETSLYLQVFDIVCGQ
jgi:hypothetical protein